MKKNNIHQGPHKFQHLAKQAGVSLETISEALTHSNKEVTKTYVNTKDIVNRTVGDIAFRSLKSNSGKMVEIIYFCIKKDIQEKILECL